MEDDSINVMDATSDNWDPVQGEIGEIQSVPHMDAQILELLLSMDSQPNETSESEVGTAGASSDVSQWPRGEYWKSTRPIPPTAWAPNAKLCDCPEHYQTHWPAEHAILELPKCTMRCPYCQFQSVNRVKDGKTHNASPEIRRHIRQYHLSKGTTNYPGISVQMLRPAQLKYPQYNLTYGDPPPLDNNQDDNVPVCNMPDIDLQDYNNMQGNYVQNNNKQTKGGCV